MTTYSPAYVAPDLIEPIHPIVGAGYRPRSILLPVWFAVPVLTSFLSYMIGGSPGLMDLSFVMLGLLCSVFLVNELIFFPRRFGIGAMTLFGGVLIWFCYDYFETWYAVDWAGSNVAHSKAVVSKCVFLHCLFVFMMVIGLMLPFGRWLERVFYLVPEPESGAFYLGLIVVIFAVTVSPYFLFTVDPWYQAIWDDINGQRFAGAKWRIRGQGGNYNINLSWGAYLTILLQIGQFGGQLAVFYAVLVARNPITKFIGWFMWLFWLAMAFGSGTRGQVVFMAVPAIALVYFKYQALAAVAMRFFSKRAYLWCAMLGIVMLFMVQVQGYFRGAKLTEGDLSMVQVTKLKGTMMFSIGLKGMAEIPERTDVFYDNFPGEKYIRPLPEAAVNFFINIIPRALWKSKPMDKVFIWHTELVTGRSALYSTNITPGIVAWWYFRYGVPGVIQGGLLFGWLLIVAERAIRNAEGRTITILFGLAFTVWLFRSYRIWFYNRLYPVVLAGVVLFIIIKLIQMMNVRRAG